MAEEQDKQYLDIYPYAPSGWKDYTLPAELDTSGKRLGAVLTIVKNGAQSLTVLNMEPDASRWESYFALNARLLARFGQDLMDPVTTKKHLISTLEPFGLAARSDNEWAITEFGIAMKPALIYAWQQLIALGVDGGKIFGTLSTGRRSKERKLVSTVAFDRAVVLANLHAKGTLRIVDIAVAAKHSLVNTRENLDQLKNAKLITKDSANPPSGEPITIYHRNENDGLEWQHFRDSKGFYLHTASEQVKAGIVQMSAQFTIGQIVEYINTQLRPSEKPLDMPTISAILAHYARAGKLKVEKFNKNVMSEIALTPLGKSVVERLILPLVKWATNEKSIQEINEIANKLRLYPWLFEDLYKQIAQSYKDNSPFKNKDPFAKEAQAYTIIGNAKNGISYSDIARKAGVTRPGITPAIKSLIAKRIAYEQTDSKGITKLFIK